MIYQSLSFMVSRDVQPYSCANVSSLADAFNIDNIMVCRPVFMALAGN
jgi:hypothetical protein